jgi:hypothetical protein
MGRTPEVKSDERRGLGSAPLPKFNKRATDEALLSLSSYVGTSANSESTMALGIYETASEKVIMVALQEGAEINGDILNTLTTCPDYNAYKTVQARVPSAPGLHAEMMIVRDLMLGGLLDPLDVNKSAAGIKLRIVCPEKRVCPDCAGYLRKHGIPHYPVESGKASPNWVNPRTGACFRVAGKKVGFYYKVDPIRGNKESGNPVDANAGNLGPLKRIGGYKSGKRRMTTG